MKKIILTILLATYTLSCFSQNFQMISISNYLWKKDDKRAKDCFQWSKKKYPNSIVGSYFDNPVKDTIFSSISNNFPERCLGVWEGTMKMYSYDKLRDSVKVRFTAARTDVDGTYIWKTEYLSKTTPMVKDYKLLVDDLDKGKYILSEGNGIELVEYCVDNKLYSLFKVQDIWLTSTTELIDKKLIFEVTSGRELNQVNGIKNYSFTNLQRVVMQQIK